MSVWVVGYYILALPGAYLAALGSAILAYIAFALFDTPASAADGSTPRG